MLFGIRVWWIQKEDLFGNVLLQFSGVRLLEELGRLGSDLLRDLCLFTIIQELGFGGMV